MAERSTPQTVLLCRCSHAGLIPADELLQVEAALRAAGGETEVVPDLCRLAAERSPVLTELASRGSLAVVACYPRAVKWLLHAAGVDVSGAELRFVNLRTNGGDEALAELGLESAPPGEAADEQTPSLGNWVPWFPVIEYSRCCDCKQCLSFCLFGVYELSDDGRVVVANPRHCKNNCPACARICPDTAIIFPKLDEAPINGAPLDSVAPDEAKVNVDPKQLLGDDPYAALMARREKRDRGRLLRPEAYEKALNERRECEGDE